MISRRYRFHGYGSLNFVYKNGQTSRGSLFSVKYADNPRRNSYRVAVVVSKKVHKSAVARNRIRRRIYEVVRSLNIDSNPAKDILITVFSAKVIDLEINELKQTLAQQLKQAKII